MNNSNSSVRVTRLQIRDYRGIEARDEAIGPNGGIVVEAISQGADEAASDVQAEAGAA